MAELPLKINFEATPDTQPHTSFLCCGVSPYDTSERVVVGNSKSVVPQLCCTPDVFVRMTSAAQKRKIRSDLKL
jgi:hypothetical protein